MRTINSDIIKQAVRDLFLSACRMPGDDALSAIRAAYQAETCPPSKEALRQLIENARVSDETGMPYCQDTGMAVVFVDVGQDVHVEGVLDAAINEGVREAYEQGYFRKSVRDPITGINTNDNTPAVIHYDIVEGDRISITAAPKGFGSENMSRIAMLKPGDGISGIKSFVVDCVKSAGGSPCPPVVLGVGIGGTFEKCALIAKKQLLREIGSLNSDTTLAVLEQSLKDEINALDIGVMGFGGSNYCLAVHIATYPTHIAGLPVAVNFQCHASRHAHITI
ncbi:MAG: fumarate hydratase [Eubacteriales bacterium]|nr:fumarate hydratase [Eubacteriales bacterium]